MAVSLGFWLLFAVSPVVTLPPPIPEPVSASSQRTAAATTDPHLLYLNFDGATLTRSPSCSDAISNCSFIISAGMTSVNFPAFSGSGQARADIIAKVVEFYAPFNVEVTIARPPSGPYSMVMVGGRAATIGLTG